jgi:DNA-binding CsgD family transcriptional regulator
MPFERARTLFVAGTLYRRMRKRSKARSVLAEAAGEFERLGARAWATRARDEVARVSTNAGTGDGLTGAERRVAALAIAGHSNKEIAHELFVSVHTVEVHLSRTYAKLGVRSRSQLASRLDHGAIGAHQPTADRP